MQLAAVSRQYDQILMTHNSQIAKGGKSFIFAAGFSDSAVWADIAAPLYFAAYLNSSPRDQRGAWETEARIFAAFVSPSTEVRRSRKAAARIAILEIHIPKNAMNIALFLPNWIGDVVMATPTLRALRKRFPDAHFTGVMRPYVADVLAGTSWLNERLFYKPGAKDPDLRAWALVRKLRERKIDAVVMFTNSLSTGLLSWMSGAKDRIGYVRYGRGPLLTTKLYHPRKGRGWLPTPGIDAYLQLAYAMGCNWESPGMEVATTEQDERAADAIWNKFGLPSGDQVVVLNSGGAFGAAKLWPTEYFGELAGKLARERGLAVLVNCGPSEKVIAAEIAKVANHSRVVSLADEDVPIGLTKACIRRSRLLVTTDSGPRFFGVAFGIPTVSLFGPTHIAWSRTHAHHEICLAKPIPCGPCMERVCPLGHHRCMRDLTVNEVLVAVDRQLAASHRAAA